MNISKRDIQEIKINLAKIYDGLKEACNLYGLKLEFDKENYLDNSTETRIIQNYKTKIIYTKNKKRYLLYNDICYTIIEIGGFKSKFSVPFYRVVLLNKLWDGYWIKVKFDDFKDLSVFFLEKFHNMEILTGDEMIIKDIIE